MKLHDSIKNKTLTERQENQERVFQGVAITTYSMHGSEYDLFLVPDPLYCTSDPAHDSHNASVICPRGKGKKPVVFTPRSSSGQLLYGKSGEADIDKCLRSQGYEVLTGDTNGPFGPLLANDWDYGRDEKERVLVAAGRDIEKVKSLIENHGPTIDGNRYAEETFHEALVLFVDEQNRYARLTTARWDTERSQWTWGEEVSIYDCTLRPISNLALGAAYLGYGLSVPIDVITIPFQAIYFLWMWNHPM